MSSVLSLASTLTQSMDLFFQLSNNKEFIKFVELGKETDMKENFTKFIKQSIHYKLDEYNTFVDNRLLNGIFNGQHANNNIREWVNRVSVYLHKKYFSETAVVPTFVSIEPSILNKLIIEYINDTFTNEEKNAIKSGRDVYALFVDKVGNDISEILYPYFETLKNHDMNEDKFRGFISGLFDGLKMINDIMEYQTRYVLPIVNNNESDSESTIEFSSDFDSEDEKSEHDNKNLKRERDESEDSDNEYNERDNKRPRK
jgi:hypothetical protein